MPNADCVRILLQEKDELSRLVTPVCQMQSTGKISFESYNTAPLAWLHNKKTVLQNPAFVDKQIKKVGIIM